MDVQTNVQTDRQTGRHRQTDNSDFIGPSTGHGSKKYCNIHTVSIRLICKDLGDHPIYQETIQLAQTNNLNLFIIHDKCWPCFNDFFLEPENHQFRTSSSKGAARNFLKEG